MEPVVAIDGVPDPDWSWKETVYDASFRIVVEPTQPIEGIVRDASTGDPLPGVIVESHRMTRRGFSNLRLVRAVSDEQGHYRLVGMPKGPGKQIMAVPNNDQPYLMQKFDVPDQPGIEPITLDLDMHRGVWITGRVTDKATGEPIHGRQTVAQYYAYLSNPFAQALPEFEDGGNTHTDQNRYRIDEDGRFRLVGLPGKAIVGARLWNMPYPQGQGAELIDEPTSTGTSQPIGWA